jgi:hypothetical protein
MRALSERQAKRCETAQHPACKCRCGGALHGAKRAPEPERPFFEALSENDPHHITSAIEQRRQRKLARAGRRRAQAEARGQTNLFEGA